MSKNTIYTPKASEGLDILKDSLQKVYGGGVPKGDVAFLPAADFPDLEKQKEKVNGNDGPKIPKPTPKFR